MTHAMAASFQHVFNENSLCEGWKNEKNEFKLEVILEPAMCTTYAYPALPHPLLQTYLAPHTSPSLRSARL